MDNGINSRVAIFVLLALVLFIAGCGSNARAPIIEGWARPSADYSYYIVQQGDTLYSIAWAFGKDYRDLAVINNISAPYHLVLGQRLRISSRSKNAWQKQKSTSKKQIETKNQQKSLVVQRPVVSAKNFVFNHWVWPTKGKIIHGFSTKNGGNKGIDISGRVGQPIISSAPGTVVYSGTGLRAYGQLIIIKHNSDYLSAYAHNQSMLVKEGQVVMAGQKIATMGKDNGGRVMLHFEIRRNGIPINPLRYF